LAKWNKEKENAFKQKFKDIPFDPAARARYYSEHTRKAQLDYIEKFKGVVSQTLQKAFDGFDWAAVPIGAPELWAKETAGDLQTGLEALKASLNMAAVTDLEAQTTAPASWEFEVGNHRCLKLK